jgi:hypothetical protein
MTGGGPGELLREKAALLETLLRETRRQSALLARSDMEGLGGSIKARQACMDAIDRIDGRIREGIGFSSLSGDAGAADLLSGMEALLKIIREADGENRKNAGKLAATFMSGIKETNAEKNLLAYAAAAPAGFRYVNKKG